MTNNGQAVGPDAEMHQDPALRPARQRARSSSVDREHARARRVIDELREIVLTPDVVVDILDEGDVGRMQQWWANFEAEWNRKHPPPEPVPMRTRRRALQV